MKKLLLVFAVVISGCHTYKTGDVVYIKGHEETPYVVTARLFAKSLELASSHGVILQIEEKYVSGPLVKND